MLSRAKATLGSVHRRIDATFKPFRIVRLRKSERRETSGRAGGSNCAFSHLEILTERMTTVVALDRQHMTIGLPGIGIRTGSPEALEGQLNVAEERNRLGGSALTDPKRGPICPPLKFAYPLSPISVPTCPSLRRAQFAVGGVPGACFFQTPSLSALA